jgi:hypothetical protein
MSQSSDIVDPLELDLIYDDEHVIIDGNTPNHVALVELQLFDDDVTPRGDENGAVSPPQPD